jgi:hypothetical protein
MTSTVMVAKTASLWASLARLLANRWLKTSNSLGAFCRTISASLAAGAEGLRYSNKGSNKSMNNRLTQRERRHLAAVKEMPCGVCGASGPSDAHHIEQGQQFLCIPLCYDCHRGTNGLHGTKALWRVRKLDELKVLNDTIETLTR